MAEVRTKPTNIDICNLLYKILSFGLNSVYKAVSLPLGESRQRPAADHALGHAGLPGDPPRWTLEILIHCFILWKRCFKQA